MALKLDVGSPTPLPSSPPGPATLSDSSSSGSRASLCRVATELSSQTTYNANPVPRVARAYSAAKVPFPLRLMYIGNAPHGIAVISIYIKHHLPIWPPNYFVPWYPGTLVVLLVLM